MPLDSRLLIDQFPTPTAVFEGHQHIVVAASAAYRKIVGGVDPVGKPLEELAPQFVEQGLAALVDEALDRRERRSGTAVPARWDADGDGVAEEHFIDYYLQPLVNEAGEVRRVLLQIEEATDRVRREREERFLATATHVLASSLDYQITLATLTRLAVEEVADWCAVDELQPDGTLRRIAVAHPDPAKVELARQLQERYPSDPASPHGVHEVLRTGRTQWADDIPDELIRAAAKDEEHLRLVMSLGLRSYIIVPLKARGSMMGALTLVAAESGRRYGAAEVRLAEELARRAGIAIDNARLYRESEESRLRAEEIAMELELQAQELQQAQVEVEMANEELQQANDELEDRAHQAELARAAAEAATERVERLQAVAAALSDVVSPARVARIAVEHGATLFGARSATMACLTPDGARLEVVHSTGVDPRLIDRFATFPVDARLPLADAVREHRPVYIASDAERRALYAELAEDYPATDRRSWAAIPLLVEGRVLGGLALGFPEAREFPPEDRAFLEAVGQQCAQALERARLFEAEAEARERIEILADAGVLLARSLDLDATLGDLARLVVPRVADWCFVEMPAEDGRIEPVSVHHRDPALVRLVEETMRRYPIDPGAEVGTAHVLRSGEPEVVPEIPEGLLESLARDEEHRRAYERVAFRSYISVPLVVRGRPLGVLSLVMAESGRRFSPEDLPFVQELARRASMAVDNARLYDAERRARTEAEEANRAKTEFLSAMSHELRTPLNAIAGYVDVLDLGVHGALTEAQRRDLERIKRNQEILLGLISDVLNFARMEAGRIEFSSEPVPVEPLLRGVEEVIGPDVRAHGLDFAQPGEVGDLVALGDPDRIQQILLNLLSNAVKFTDPGGTVAVDAAGAGGEVVIRVRDTGRGIPPDKLEAIFDPFVQLDRHRTDRSQQGVGLGLAISRDLARQMGGDLTVESAPDVGSTFTLTLPRAG